jgi:hypothetical protein
LTFQIKKLTLRACSQGHKAKKRQPEFPTCILGLKQHPKDGQDGGYEVDGPMWVSGGLKKKHSCGVLDL